MSKPANTLPTLEELVAASQKEPCQPGRPAKWPCLDGLSQKERKKCMSALRYHQNKEKYRERNKRWAIAHPERMRQMCLNYRIRNAETFKANTKKWKQSEKGKAYKKRLYQENKHKWVARRITRKAILNGTLIKTECEVCGNPEVEAHHPDYSKPLNIMWLCREHHTDIHYPNRQPATLLK